MEFLDINLTKDSSLLLRAIHSRYYWCILQKINKLNIGFKNPLKNLTKKENSSLCITRIL